jgi:hypothetical protein
MRTYGRSSTSQIIQTANWASVSTGGLRSARYSSERKQFAIHSLGAYRDSYFLGELARLFLVQSTLASSQF